MEKTASQTTDCTYLEGCPIFQYFRKCAERAYMVMYCQGRYETCKRYQLRTAGKEVPNNMMPFGVIWDDLPAS